MGGKYFIFLLFTLLNASVCHAADKDSLILFGHSFFAKDICKQEIFKPAAADPPSTFYGNNEDVRQNFSQNLPWNWVGCLGQSGDPNPHQFLFRPSTSPAVQQMDIDFFKDVILPYHQKDSLIRELKSTIVSTSLTNKEKYVRINQNRNAIDRLTNSYFGGQPTSYPRKAELVDAFAGEYLRLLHDDLVSGNRSDAQILNRGSEDKIAGYIKKYVHVDLQYCNYRLSDDYTNALIAQIQDYSDKKRSEKDGNDALLNFYLDNKNQAIVYSVSSWCVIVTVDAGFEENLNSLALEPAIAGINAAILETMKYYIGKYSEKAPRYYLCRFGYREKTFRHVGDRSYIDQNPNKPDGR